MKKKFRNHLAEEKSPYLLQHAQNPVDWYPWCKEAFLKAAAEEKPVFLSIGYSTCHWCHVMEQESFSDEEVARLLNESYISIKVDREERPDIDNVYMNVCQMQNGSGGWPLTIVMTPEQKPFYSATYLPKENRYGQPGLCTLLEQIREQWKQKAGREKIYQAADNIMEAIKSQESEHIRKKTTVNFSNSSLDIPTEPLVQAGAGWLAKTFDKAQGGFGRAPKFPVPHNLLFLMKLYEVEENPKWLEMVEITLRQMYRGGLFDHIGGGFSRYAVDDRWLVPHFEKMLYDNALLSLAYLEAYRMSGEALYLEVAHRTLDYMDRELGQKAGGFCCGQDADSEGEEGRFYVLEPKEVEQVLGHQLGKQFCSWYGITEGGNFEKKSIPNLLQNERYSEKFPQREKVCSLLWEYRQKRAALYRDDKILTAWNGLAIWAYAKAYQITGQTAYYKLAKKAASFVRANLMTLNGRLKVRWRENHAAHEGNLDDYAFYALALLELYQCDFDVSWLRTCMRLSEKLLELFEDKTAGGLFFYGTEGEELISRPKETYDGTIPSGNAVAGLLLVRLAALSGEKKWQCAAERQMNFLKTYAQGEPLGHSMTLFAALEQRQHGIHLVCCSNGEIPKEEIRCFRKKQKETVHAIVITKENEKALTRLLPRIAEYPLEGAEPVYYICRGKNCQPPVTEL